MNEYEMQWWVPADVDHNGDGDLVTAIFSNTSSTVIDYYQHSGDLAMKWTAANGFAVDTTIVYHYNDNNVRQHSFLLNAHARRQPLTPHRRGADSGLSR